MPRKKKPKADQVSPELDIRTMIQINTKKRDQKPFGTISCPACTTTDKDGSQIPTPLVAIPERTTPLSGPYACTVCAEIIRIEALAINKLQSSY